MKRNDIAVAQNRAAVAAAIQGEIESIVLADEINLEEIEKDIANRQPIMKPEKPTHFDRVYDSIGGDIRTLADPTVVRFVVSYYEHYRIIPAADNWDMRNTDQKIERLEVRADVLRASIQLGKEAIKNLGAISGA